MKAEILISTILIFIVAACSGNKQKDSLKQNDNAISADSIGNSDILGQWHIENIFFNDSNYVRPLELNAAGKEYILFESEGNYLVMTGCNYGVGNYIVSHANISFGDAAWTELACDNMEVEEAVKKILPMLRTVEIENDSVLRINSAFEPYLILIRKRFDCK